MKIFSGVLIFLLFTGTALAGVFTDNHDGTVIDNVTSLVWQQQVDGVGRDWETALSYCENLSLGTHTDWRLPNLKELLSITDDSRFSPAIDTTAFPNTSSVLYWSSTTDRYGIVYAWSVDFLLGDIGTYTKSGLHYVRCTRGGQ